MRQSWGMQDWGNAEPLGHAPCVRDAISLVHAPALRVTQLPQELPRMCLPVHTDVTGTGNQFAVVCRIIPNQHPLGPGS